MTKKGFTAIEGVVIVALVLVVIGIVSMSKKKTELSTTAPAVTDTATSNSTATADWKTYRSEELGLSFKFPGLPGEARYFSSDDPKDSYNQGTFYGWTITRKDIFSQRWTYTFVASYSADTDAGRESWPTDNVRWYAENGKYYLERIGGKDMRKIEVNIDKKIKLPSGAEGIILSSEKNVTNYLFTIDFEGTNKGKLAVINFPPNYRKKTQLKSISFYFYDPISTEQIAEVINSVTFTK